MDQNRQGYRSGRVRARHFVSPTPSNDSMQHVAAQSPPTVTPPQEPLPRKPKKPRMKRVLMRPDGLLVIRLPKFVQKTIHTIQKHRLVFRLLCVLFVALIIGTLVYEAYVPKNTESKYNIAPSARPLLSEPNARYAEKLTYDGKARAFEYNKGYQPEITGNQSGFSGGPKYSATFQQDPEKGISIQDPQTQSKVTFKPDYHLADPRQDSNRLIYPVVGRDATKVYTVGGVGFKEDILLNSFQGDNVSFTYELQLDDGLEARLMPNGSLGIYGVQNALLGNVSTGSEKDAELLKNARTNGKKDNLIFVFPAPYVKEAGIGKSNVATSKFVLNGKKLTVETTGLEKAKYPLSIDPSVYLDSAAEFMRGNNETNIDFDVTNSLIDKGVLTGGRFETWTASTALNAARWNGATVVAGGYVYLIGGSNGTTNFGNVYWAKLNTSTYTIDSPTPGNGAACTNWCTNTQYDLPSSQVRRGLSAVAYNGYLYAIGGKDAACAGTNTVCGTVYVAKVGANGEPISWSATSSLSTDRSYFSATVYNNKIYASGGQTDASLNGDTGVESADVKPDGTLGTWTTTGMTALPATRWGHTMLQYNGYLYLVGGISTATVQSSIYYNKLKSDGTMASSWTATTSFGTARGAYGGNFATIWGGYMYIVGGCSAVTTTNCSTGISNANGQLASINADGTISDWTAFTLTGSTGTLHGQGLVAWRNTIYTIGGCSVATTTSNCGTAITTTRYGTLKTDGDVSPKSTETALPTIGNGAGQVGTIGAVVVVNDGYIYNVGGCINVGCTAASDQVGYAPINNDGTIGAWSTSDGVFKSTSGLTYGSGVVYNNYIYFIGGTDGAGNWTRSIWRGQINTGTHAVGTFTEQTNQTPNATAYGMSHSVVRSINGTSGTLYVAGGCYSTGTGVGCGTTWFTDVFKCTISHTDGSVSGCSTASQLQIQDLDASTAGTQGLGAGAVAIWGDYIYIAGGVCGLSTTSGATAETNGCDGSSTTTVNTSEVSKVYYAKINASGNIVRADNGNATGGWQIASNKMPIPRRRGVAFAVNGYLYEAGGHDGTTGGVGTLSDIVYSKIDPITGNLGAFASVSQSGSTSNIITSRWGHGYVAANGYLYFIGGCTTGAPAGSCSTISTNTESVQVYNNYSGSPYAYNTTGLIGTDRWGSSSAVYNGVLYITGGCSSAATDCEASPATGTWQSDTQYATLNDDGTITSWTNAGSATLPTARGFGCMVAVAGASNAYLYYMGGRDSTTAAFGTVYYSLLTAGVPGAWTAATKGIGDTGSGAQARMSPGCAVNNSKVYVTGGANATPTYQTTVYVSPTLGSGDISSNWTSTTAFTTARSGHTLIAYGNTLYVLGGFDGTNYLIDTQYAALDSSGNVTGSWGVGTSLPVPMRQASGFAANGYIYMFGGRSASTTCTASTYSTSIAGYGPGSSSRYGIGTWSQTNVKYTGSRYGLNAVYYQGKTYLMGGICNATLTGANRTVYSTLLAQPLLSKYSFYIDTDKDVFPTKFLLNGIDNGIGAKWQLNYKSATDTTNVCATMTTFGQNTNYGDVTLGTPAAYTPKDGSGTNTNCARWYYMLVTIDVSGAFGYPEDVTRGPTITDLTLQYTASPSGRLRHGKTFTGGVQQPLDTPCGSPSC